MNKFEDIKENIQKQVKESQILRGNSGGGNN